LFAKGNMSSNFSLIEIQGDLFDQKNDSLAHCVSEDLVMGKGITKTFKQKFGHVNKLRNQQKSVGEVCFLQDECDFSRKI